MVWWFRWDRNHQGRDLCTSRTRNRFTWSGLIIYSGGDIRRDDQCFNLLLWCHHFFLCWIHAYNMDWVGMCKLTGKHLVKWRCWYSPELTTAPNHKVMCTLGMHNRVMWSGFIIHSGIDNRRDDPWFTLLLRCYRSLRVLELHTMRLFASLQLLGGSVSWRWLSVWGEATKASHWGGKIFIDLVGV